jgi:hypothetical protein
MNTDYKRKHGRPPGQPNQRQADDRHLDSFRTKKALVRIVYMSKEEK